MTDLLETCVDEVLQAAVPMVMAEEAGPSSSLTTASEETLSLSEAAARLKQLEIENTPVTLPAKTNINLNNQEEVVKLTEKSLNNVGASPVVNQLKAPGELKSNILKAQAEAALKDCKDDVGLTTDKNCNLQDSACRLTSRGPGESVSVRGDKPESWEQPVPLMPASTSSLELNPEDFISSVASLSASLNETHSPQLKVPEAEPASAPLTDNLIDFTDPAPVVPAPKPTISPRWIIPASAPTTGTFTNGLFDAPATITPPHLSHTHHVIATSVVGHSVKEDGHKPKGLLTTEL